MITSLDRDFATVNDVGDASFRLRVAKTGFASGKKVWGCDDSV